MREIVESHGCRLIYSFLPWQRRWHRLVGVDFNPIALAGSPVRQTELQLAPDTYQIGLARCFDDLRNVLYRPGKFVASKRRTLKDIMRQAQFARHHAFTHFRSL